MTQERSKSVWTALACGILCAIFAGLAWGAVRGKSATWDEPSHALTGWLMLWRHDYRLSPDVPPLWEDWIALGMGKEAVHFDAESPQYRRLQSKIDQFTWCGQTLYHTPGNDGIELVRRGRMMALIPGVLLAALIGLWAWELGGAVAAVCATFLYCLDPNFLGHAPLVKNDVAFTLVYFAAALALWRFGRRITWTSAAAVVLLTATAIVVKLTGVLLAPVLLIALTYRAWMSQPWIIVGRTVQRRGVKLLAALAVCVATSVAAYAGLWASYGFRFDAGPDGMRCDTAYCLASLRLLQVYQSVGHPPTTEELLTWRMPLSTRAMLFIQRHRLLPQAWTSGFILTQYGDENRGAFLCNDVYKGGKWFYFPLAAAFKTPLATIAASLLALAAGRRARRAGLLRIADNRWTAVSLALPAGVYALAIMTANLNIGIRHAFPVYPFVYVAVSLAAARAWRAIGGRLLILILGAGLAAETMAAFPNYIAFFNVASAPHRLSLLSDSNLDWGQDLPLLADWQHRHPDQKLYLDYFGLCDPAAYGIRYVNVPPGYQFGPKPVWPDRPGVVAISATYLQQVYFAPPGMDITTFFLERPPQETLGNTIYLFKFDPAEMQRPNRQP